ncbi:hypothetical protein PpBr36_03950 [Pyricularia pennisetigena]|uniref:hypothetical protein n=1 Tax=Pyricularia pennisetigena TaxID=1578925 RepID=UPI00114FE5C9|nr:hypothetical protein PpBr36_03950 [Pyricularia pennisetigena]TLS30851.1 hypothetical protein PpBr36_03950 [Pyricularia pennisetigena]
MISARRYVSTVVTQWPRPQPWVLKTRRPSRHFSNAATEEANETNSDTPTTKRSIHATETPLAEQLDSLGVYRSNVPWQYAERARAKAAEAAKKAAEQSAAEAGNGVEVEKKERLKRSSSGLARLRRLIATKSSEIRKRMWETIFDTERAYQKKIAESHRNPKMRQQLVDDRPPQATKIVRDALKLYDQNNFTEAVRLKLEARLATIPLPGTIAPASAKRTVKLKKQASVDFKPKNNPRTGDKSRIHVVDEKLCDDVLKFIPSLERHKGCDIIDMYPGAGLFSQKLNDALQPRSHILLEPEPEIYQKFLEPLLQRPGSRLVPKSGIIWQDLSSVLTPEFLPHQKIQDRTPGQAPTRNDSLLVVANLGFFPNKTYLNFKSVVSMVMYQLITAIRLRSLFQKYGLVRMLLWVRPSEVDPILPRDLSKRRRPSLEAELLTEYIAEICTDAERMDYRPGVNRHGTIDVHSCRRTLDRMRKLGLAIPDGRETSKPMRYVIEAEAAGKELPKIGGNHSMRKVRSGTGEYDASEFDKGMSKWLLLRGYYGQELWEKRQEAVALWLKIHEKRNLAKSGSSDPELLKEIECLQGQFDSMAKEWNANFEYYSYGKAGMHKPIDDVHTFTMDPPVLLWDRRPVEPFMVRPQEFYPNLPLSLLDIQPKPAHPMLLENGVGSGRHGDHFERIVQHLFVQRNRPVTKLMSELAHGAVEGLDLENLESFKDPRLGGAIMKGNDVVRPVMMNERQLLDLLAAWMDWPFRLTYEELATRNREDDNPDDCEN